MQKKRKHEVRKNQDERQTLEEYLEHVKTTDPKLKLLTGVAYELQLQAHAEYYKRKYSVHVLDEDETGERSLMGLED